MLNLFVAFAMVAVHIYEGTRRGRSQWKTFLRERKEAAEDGCKKPSFAHFIAGGAVLAVPSIFYGDDLIRNILEFTGQIGANA